MLSEVPQAPYPDPEASFQRPGDRADGHRNRLITAGVAACDPIGYHATMSFLLRNIARYAARKLAADPRVRDAAAKAARVAVDEARQFAGRDDKARAAGRAVRRAINKLQGDQ